MTRLPILRAGRPYRSLEALRLPDVRTGETVAEVSLANRGLIARELREAARNRRALRAVPADEMLAVCRRAARLFADADLPIDGESQPPSDYIRRLSATSGIPETLCRANLEKIRFVLENMDRVLGGLTRGLDPALLDAGWGVQDGRPVSFLGQADALGVVLPSNSPGVHTLWIPSVALKVPVVLKPGRQEPWTPFRVLQALLAAGCPPEAAGYYPSDHAGAAEILLRCGRSMLFGDEATLRSWQNDGRVQLHGPGWSKVIFGADAAGDWERHLDLMVTSVADNGGRSCIDASGIWTPAHGRELAEGVAARLAAIPALPLDHAEARIAAFPDPSQARRISALIDRMLRVPGAEDVTARHRGGERLAEVGGCTFLLPTLVRCDDPGHPLASTELLFPFASVVEAPQDRIPDLIGPTLVATAITGDPAFQRELLACPGIERLNLAPVPTCRISWEEPHEGNLFEHLFRRRAVLAPGIRGAGPGVPAAGRNLPLADGV